MKAAVVESFDEPPQLRDFATPIAQEDEVSVRVCAAALSQLVRAQAAGKHYSSGKLPLVPGADGVGILEDGQRVYFAFPRRSGAMAEQVAVPSVNIVALPDGLDDITAAAIANPGMSSWAALTERALLLPGETVLVNGAGGASGRLAIQIAKLLGAGRVIATARNPVCENDLLALGADAFIPLNQRTESLVAQLRAVVEQGLDIVLDYLWGSPAEAIVAALSGHGAAEAAPRIRFVNIGSLAGAAIPLDAGVLRSSGLELYGSGLGSLSHAALIRSISSLMQAVISADLKIATVALPLSDVAQAWPGKYSRRVVFTLEC